MTIKEIFDKAQEGTLTYDQFMELSKEAKFTDLSEGNYVSKRKYEDELATKSSEIENLTNTISTRDTDLQELQKKLEEAGTDVDKLSELTNSFNDLKGKYDNEVKRYKEQLKAQAYEFAVKDFANSQKFTSNAAKRDFIHSMIDKKLKMDNDVILGANDFVKAYSVDNSDAFVVETPAEPDSSPKPQFADSTSSKSEPPKKSSLSDLMQAKNENPDLVLDF